MKIKDVVKLTALLLGREDVTSYLEDEENENVGSDTVSSVNVITQLVNLVVSELATSFVPLVCGEELSPVQGKIYFTELKNTPLKVVRVSDGRGAEVNYTQYPEFIAVDKRVFVASEMPSLAILL